MEQSKIIKQNLREKNIVILRSTVEIGSTEKICQKILNSANKQHEIAFCPERTLEGKDFQKFYDFKKK
tara:strand:+ start:2523 stop:2726 length:204 start_codon:yes stop_codon:yes gene_type:complete